MLVEDEPDLRAMMSEVLQMQGYSILEAGTGFDALNILQYDDSIDLLITDIVLPGGMDGFDLANRINRSNPGIPVLFMSGFAGRIDLEQMDIKGPVLRKPIPLTTLSDTIQSILET